MSADFERALRFTLRWEGGLADVEGDPGGLTNLGVTQSVYSRYRKMVGAPKRSVACITLAEAREVYRLLYWKESRAEHLEWPLSLAVFDLAVNCGVGRSNRLVAEAVGLKGSSRWNPDVSGVIHRVDPKALARRVTRLRADFYRRLALNPLRRKFLKGWLNRADALLKAIEEAP